MADSRGTNDQFNQGNCSEPYSEYLAQAAGACESGDLVLGMHLYLAAYERAVVDPDIADGMALSGLREAWNLACDLKERSMAEYVFEKLEPFLTGEEIAECATKLQDLALDRLEEYGFSREDLEDMAEMITQDLLDGDASVVKVESLSLPGASALGALFDQAEEADVPAEEDEPTDEAEEPKASADAATGEGDAAGGLRTGHPGFQVIPNLHPGRHPESSLGVAIPDTNPYELHNTSSVGKSYHAATNDGAGAFVVTRDNDRAAEMEQARGNGEGDSFAAVESAPPSVAEPESRQVNDSGRQEQGAPHGGEPDRSDVIREAEGASASAPAGEPQPRTAHQMAPPPGVPMRSNVIASGANAVQAAKPAKPAASGEDAAELPDMPEVASVGAPVFNYRALAGYGQVVPAVRELGIGLQRDPSFRNFIGMMNARHGLERMPALDTVLFRAPVIEDASRFVDATVGEVGLPVVRMSMEEGVAGAPMLCVAVQGDNRPRMNHARNRFEGPGVLVIEDLDLWELPQLPEGVEGIAGFVMANMSRGAREALNLIQSAVENPDVLVLATASTEGEPDPFFYDLLEPITIIDIANPIARERGEVINELMHDHPSLRAADRKVLVRLSEGLSRFDIYMAARAALEDAYKAGLARRMFVPVATEDVLEKFAACFPAESDEYRAIEDAIAESFSRSLDDLEQLVEGVAGELPE